MSTKSSSSSKRSTGTKDKLKPGKKSSSSKSGSKSGSSKSSSKIATKASSTSSTNKAKKSSSSKKSGHSSKKHVEIAAETTPAVVNEPVAAPVEGAAPEKKERKPTRFKPGTVANREIRRLQKQNILLLPRGPLYRLIRELAAKHTPTTADGKPGVPLRFRASALNAIHETIENVAIHRYHAGGMVLEARGRVMLTPADIDLANRLVSQPLAGIC